MTYRAQCATTYNINYTTHKLYNIATTTLHNNRMVCCISQHWQIHFHISLLSFTMWFKITPKPLTARPAICKFYHGILFQNLQGYNLPKISGIVHKHIWYWMRR